MSVSGIQFVPSGSIVFSSNLACSKLTLFRLTSRRSAEWKVFLGWHWFTQPRQPETSPSLLVDHIDYMVGVARIDHVGFGSDFDGGLSFPQALKGASDLPNITVELMARGHSDEEIDKIPCDNMRHVLAAVEAVAGQPWDRDMETGQGGKAMRACVYAAVLFDIGGVLYIPDVSLNVKWERRLGLPEGQLGEMLYANPVAERVMVGEATEEEMWDHFGRRYHLPPAELAALKYDLWEGGAWDLALLDFARSLRPQYKTGTISDAVPGTRENVKQYVNGDVFDVSVFSAEEGVKKPDAEIYCRALARLKVAPAEAIFVDDRLKNVEGARQVGMHALHFTDSVGVRQEIARLLGLAGEMCK
jgi:epoxide hydrolase-like predicted phosphatase